MLYIKRFETEKSYNEARIKEYKDPWTSSVELTGRTRADYNKGSINFNGYDYVDMGFPSGTLWAVKNLGAENNNDIGKYYQFGHLYDYQYLEDHGISTAYSMSSYIYSDIYPFYDNSTDGYTKYNETDGKKILDIEDDPARFWWGGLWETPTMAQLQELLDYTNRSGSRFTSKTDSSKYITLPAGNARNPGTSYLYDRAIIASKELGNNIVYNYILECYNGTITSIKRYGFCNIRPVITPPVDW